MGEDRAVLRRRALNRLTVMKLALQMLERQTEVSDRQRELVRTALGAADGLTADLLGQWWAERDRAAETADPRRASG